jgi:hypothetical protein
MRRLAVAASMVAAALAGCAGTSRMERDLQSMRERIDEIARSSTGVRSRIDELESRLLLVQDELETQKLATMRGGNRLQAPSLPTLPVVRVVPPDADADDTAPELPARPGAASRTDSQVLEDQAYMDVDADGRVVAPRGAKGRPAAVARDPSRDAAKEPSRRPARVAGRAAGAAPDDTGLLAE